MDIKEQGMSGRFEIYLNGTDGLKQVMRNILTTWGDLLPACGEWAESLIEFLIALLRVLLILICPFLFWLAPVIAIFTAHRVVSDDEVRSRLRAGIHKNGRVK